MKTATTKKTRRQQAEQPKAPGLGLRLGSAAEPSPEPAPEYAKKVLITKAALHVIIHCCRTIRPRLDDLRRNRGDARRVDIEMLDILADVREIEQLVAERFCSEGAA